MSKTQNQNGKRSPFSRSFVPGKRRAGSSLNPNAQHTSQDFSRVAFDSKGNFCVSIVSSVTGPKVKVFSVAQNKLELEFSVPSRTIVEAVAWCSLVEGENKKFENLALCCENGCILIYSIEDGQVILNLVDGHNGPVTDFVASDNIAFSSSTDGTVARWHLGTGKLINSWKADLGAVHKLSLNLSQKKLITGANAVKAWSTDDCRFLHDLPGHTNRVTCLTTCDKLQLCLTAAHQDRFIAVSKLTDDSTTSSPICLSVDEEIHSLVISPLGSVMGTTESGKILYWENVSQGKPVISDQPAPQEPSVSIKFVNSTKSLIPVAQTKFMSSSKKSLVARGDLWSLTFETMKFPDRFTCKEITYDCIEPTLSEQASSVQPLASKTAIKSGIASKGPSVALTLGEKLSLLQAEQGNSEDQPSPDLLPASKSLPELADSVARVISQALNTKDYKLLNATLSAAPTRSIVPTVECINQSQVHDLFQFFVDGIISQKSDPLMLSDWLRAIFAIHSSHLVSIPGISESLNEMVSTIESRTRDVASLSQLYHRINLISTQSEANSADANNTIQPALYLEGSAVTSIPELPSKSDLQDKRKKKPKFFSPVPKTKQTKPIK